MYVRDKSYYCGVINYITIKKIQTMKISIDIHRLISLGWNFDEDYYGFFINVVNSKEHFEDISVVHFYPNGYKIEYNNKEYHNKILSYDF